tara:strand:+ start:7046 stop:7267 length:222 start_codon:yes stop_codon:yes gene_type:complete
MKLYVAVDESYETESTWLFTSKKKMLRVANEKELMVQEPIIFNLTKIGVLNAIRQVVRQCGTEVFIEIGDQND